MTPHMRELNLLKQQSSSPTNKQIKIVDNFDRFKLNFGKAGLNATQFTVTAKSPFMLSPDRNDVFSYQFKEDDSPIGDPNFRDTYTNSIVVASKHSFIPSLEDR